MPAAFQASLRLKLSILTRLRIVVVMFFLPKFLNFAFESINTEDEFAEVKLLCASEVLDFITFSFLLVIFYPRKEWPDYFSLGLEALAANVRR